MFTTILLVILFGRIFTTILLVILFGRIFTTILLVILSAEHRSCVSAARTGRL
jgi:hypothetical protein